MAAIELESLLRKRDEYRCNASGYCYRYSRWNDWGRWVALAVIVIGILFIAFVFSCINNRRRRRRGMTPMYGTGWLPGAKPNGGQQNNGGYYANQPYNGGSAPPYSPPIGNQPTGNTFNSNEGYYGHHNGGYGGGYGGQQSGVELQPPQNSYQAPGQYARGGENVYEAPQGPPPGKGDGIIR